MVCKRSGTTGLLCLAGVAGAVAVAGLMAWGLAPAPAGAVTLVSQPEGMDPQEMMRLYEEKNRTGEHHDWLARCAGVWDAECSVWMDPSAPPEVSSGMERNRMLLDDRYLESEFSGEWFGEKFTGRSLMGYNNAEGRFESVWGDSTSTGLLYSTGTREGDRLEMVGEMKDCLSEQMVKYRHVMTFDGPDKRTFTGYHTMDGQEMKAMEIVYTRRGQSTRGNNPGQGSRGGNNGGG
ncbi:MAG: DUF1579 domain-containing protein [Phycisphaerales bacterium JB039]